MLSCRSGNISLLFFYCRDLFIPCLPQANTNVQGGLHSFLSFHSSQLCEVDNFLWSGCRTLLFWMESHLASEKASKLPAGAVSR